MIKLLVKVAGRNGKIVYLVILAGVFLLFVDSVRTSMNMRERKDDKDVVAAKANNEIRYFRAQRNIYLTLGFLFVSVCNKGLLTLNYKLKVLYDENKALRAQSPATAAIIDDNKAKNE